MSWSDIRGTDTECVTIVGFVVKTRSNNLLSLVELVFCADLIRFPSETNIFFTLQTLTTAKTNLA